MPDPTPLPVTSVLGRDIAALLAPHGPRRQSLRGFDDDYLDIVDYIVRCTHRIWEEKKLHLIRSHYSADCPLHTLAGEVVGAEAVVANTAKTLAGFPDRTLYADHVIWGGNDEDGFYSSHRISSHMTNLGDSEFGPPTGRRATVTTIADCVVKENRIVEEWLVRDNMSLVLQLGLDPHAIARQRAAARAQAGPPSGPPPPEPEWTPAHAGDPLAPVCLAAADRWRALWNARDFSLVRAFYEPTCALHAPSGRELFGHGEIVGWYVHVIGALTDAVTRVGHVCAVPRGPGEIDVAIRWTLDGTHLGPGFHRPPTGRPVHVLGVTHWHLVGDRVAEEWTVFDEVAVLTQLYGGAQ